jgi:PPOX class probable F420-dependent enzyme
MTVAIDEKLAARLQTEQIIWLTTVREDGTPQPTPVWFYWHEESMLIFTQPQSQKLRNIAANPKVALNLHTDEYGGSVAVLWGEAYVDPQGASPAEIEAYMAKYAAGIKMLGWTPEQMANSFSTALRVPIARVRKME